MRPDRFSRGGVHSVVVPDNLYDIGLFIHFSVFDTAPKLSLDPAFGEAGPRALYAYPIQRGVQMTFGSDRAYGFVMERSGTVIDSDTYTWTNLERDVEALRAVVGSAVVATISERFRRVVAKLSARYHKAPFGTLYYLIAKCRRVADEDPVRWSDGAAVEDPEYANEIWQKIGYDVIIDRNGTIYSSEPVQAAFLNNSSFRVVGKLVGEAE